MKKKQKTTREKIFDSLKIIAFIWIASSLAAALFMMNIDISSGNIAVIPIKGTISVDSPSGFTTTGTSSEKIIEYLDEAEKDKAIKAVILDINSGGGSGVAADEISQKIKSMNKTTVAVIREMGASAAYWIASSTDTIYANRLSLTGSIGVYGSYLDFSGFLEEYNISYQRYVSGEYKDMASPLKEPSEEERELFQAIIDESQGFFLDEIRTNRNLSEDTLRMISQGQVIMGTEAKELGLIDYLGTKQDAIRYIENELNITAAIVEYEEKTSFLSLLQGMQGTAGDKIGKFINPVKPISFQT